MCPSTLSDHLKKNSLRTDALPSGRVAYTAPSAAALPPQREVTPAPEANEKGRNNPGSGAVAAPPRTRQDRKAKLGPFLHRLKVALTTPEYQRFKLLLRAFKQAQGNTASTGKLEGLVNDVARILDHARGRTPLLVAFADFLPAACVGGGACVGRVPVLVCRSHITVLLWCFRMVVPVSTGGLPKCSAWHSAETTVCPHRIAFRQPTRRSPASVHKPQHPVPLQLLLTMPRLLSSPHQRCYGVN